MNKVAGKGEKGIYSSQQIGYKQGKSTMPRFIMSSSHTPSATPSPSAPEIIEVEERQFPCDGGARKHGWALGHPLVFLTVGPGGTVDCPYCDRHFILKGSARGGHH
jgi:uncharacterized Zn-finger protein